MTLGRARDAVLTLVAERVGRPRPASLVRLDGPGGPARVFGVDVELGEGGARAVVVKCFDSPRLFAQERDALGRWLDVTGELGGARVPALVAVAPSERALVYARLPGVRPEPAGADADAPAIHRAAGRFLAALHRLDIPDRDPLPLAEALARRYRSWARAVAQIEGALDADQQRLVEELAPSAASFGAVTRVPCHRDFTPDNWLWDGRRLAVIDFEHARLDLALGDLAKLAVEWPARPELRLAFFAGYGRSLSAADDTRLRIVVALHGLASLAWGLRHGAPRFVAEGQRALALAASW
ncbi:homoserine kinase [Enhygromyxa salina]|uniref:Homoserine kinase n=1 Tax=Enhygromyxa salina TaxID=215803 RepID=A0A2S9XAK4_9BACT|nr:aminoglycoside phosphotransferase family protein [Enhygromyxa salina]PRP89883.1 homoserine kinase [Enhygromyxa salina]